MFKPRPFARRYLLLDKIATGGMAEVFKAKSYGIEGFEKLVVIKRILPHLSHNPRFVSMFINEAKIAVSLNHSNIAQVFHLGKEGEDYFIAMEYVHGRDLMQVLRMCREKGQSVPIPLLLYIAAEVSRGLDFAHRKADRSGKPLKIIHRDISPHNVIVSFEGEVKIVDFGIARITSELMGNSPEGRVGGKYAYMSPEQAEGRNMDSRSDLFSLGLVCYELLTGRKAYQGQDLVGKLEAVRGAKFVPPGQLRPDLPPGLEAILMRLLAKDPDDRFQSAGELYEELTDLSFKLGDIVTAQEASKFMRRLFAEEIDREHDSSGLTALLGAIDRMGGEVSTPTGISITEAGDETSTGAERAVGPFDPNRTRPTGQLLPVSVQDYAKRNVILLLVDPHGLLDLSLQMPDDDYLRLHLELLEYFDTLVTAHGGIIDRVVNDRVYAMWGLVRTQEDDAERAVACAQALKEAVARFSKERGVSLDVTAAVHQGPALVSAASTCPRCLALGDTARLPERVVLGGNPGSILVSEVVRQLCARRFEFEEEAPVAVGWGSGQVQVHRLISERPNPDRAGEGGGGQGGGERWYGRKSELQTLRRALARVSERKGFVLGVTGEAGIGKSRFGREVGRLIKKSDVGWWVGVALYRQRETPLALFRDMIGSWCGITSGDSAEQVVEKLATLSQAGLDEIDRKSLASLFQPFDDLHTPLHRSQEGHEGIFRAFRRLVRGMCADRPNVVLIEDLQWMDPLSLRLVADIAETASGLPLLLLVTYRSGFQPPFANEAWFEEMTLERLDQESTTEMARRILRVEEIPSSLAAELYRRSDGNPLHLEQLVKLLVEGGHLVVTDGRVKEVGAHAASRVPPTVQGLIESRVDGLSEAGRDVVEVLAVIGRRADWDVARQVTMLGEALESVVRELRERDLVVTDERRITFRDHMTWEVVYNKLLHRRRVLYHQRVAETLESFWEGDLRRHAEEIFHHFEAAGQLVKASRYAGLAGDRYRNEEFFSKAIDFYQKAIDLLRDSDVAGDEIDVLRRTAELSLKAGQLQGFLGDRDGAELTLERGLDYASDVEDSILEAKLLLELGRVRADLGDRFLAQSYLEHALELSEAQGDLELSCMVLDALGSFYLEAGENEASARAFDKGLELASRLGNPVAIARLLRGKGTYRIRVGEYAGALQQFSRALELAREASDTILSGRILNNIGNTHCFLGEYSPAMDAYRHSGEILMSAGFMRGAIINYHNIGDLYFRQGKLGKAYTYFRESRNMAREYRWAMGEASNLVYMGYIKAEGGDSESGMAMLQEGVAMASEFHLPEWVATGRWLEGLHIAKREPERAGAVLEEALTIATSLRDKKLVEEVRKALHAIRSNGH